MAKHCDVCNQDYADDLPGCPSCASAKKTHLAGRVEDRKTQLADMDPADLAGEPTPSDSAIDLDQTAAAKSATGEQASADQGRIDSPADADLPARGPGHPGEETETVMQSSFSLEPAPAVSDSTVDLGASPVELVEDGADAREAAASDSAVFMAELASDASHVDLVDEPGASAAPGAERPSGRDLIAEAVESGIDLGSPEAELTEQADLDAVGVDEHASGVDLGASPSESAALSSSLEAEEVVEATGGSGIDLEGLTVPASSGRGIHAASDSAVDLGSRDDMPPPPEGAEAVVADSAVDLGSASDLPLESLPAESPSGMAAVEEEAVIDEGAVVEEHEVNDLLAGLEQETIAGDAGLAAVAGEEGVVAAEEEAVIEDGVVAAETEGEQAAVSEAEVDDLLASLEQETVAGEEGLAAVADEEVVGEAAEEEGAVAEAEEEEEKPAKPVKQRSRIPSLIGGTFFGLLLGAGGLIGARFAGVDVAEMIGVSAKKPSEPVVPQVKAPTFEEQAAHVRNGDWNEAEKAGIERIQEDKPEELAVRGEYRLGIYLQKAGAKVNLQDPPLQQAVADLQKAAEAKNLDALYDLGLINELANKLPEARAEYTKGVNAAGNDPIQKRRFESALARLDLKASGHPVPAALLLPERVEDRVAFLALLLIGLQQPPAVPPAVPPAAPPGAPPAAPQAGGEEAGFDFWLAAKLARAGKLVGAGGAIEVLEKARKLHDARRFTRLRKAQNPLSDPTEDIFLRCCDELKQYWQLQSYLREGKYLTEKNTPAEALQSLLKKADESTATVEKVAEKLVMEKIIKAGEDPVAGVEGLIKEKKDAETKAADLTTALKKAEDKAKDDATKAAAKLKMTEEDRDTKLKAAGDREQKLKTAHDDLNTTLKKIGDELAAAKFFDPKGKPDVGEAVRKVVDIAKMKDPQGTISQQRRDIAQLTASLKERWRPEEMMPFWLLMLDQNRGRAELATKATLDVERVKGDQTATPAHKGEAEVVLGLALRNTEKFAEAKTVLESARGAVDKGDWLLRADAALKDVSDPATYFARQAQLLYDRGEMDAALAILDHALKTLPDKDHGRLFAQRSLIELDAARSKVKGPLPAKEPLVLAAQKDAAEAIKAGLAEGHYAAGRIAEELGQWESAIASYRKALAAHPALDADGSRYRVSLARVLLQPRDVRPGQPLPPPVGDKVGWRDPAPYPARAWHDMKLFTLMIVLGLQAPPLPGEQPDLEEAERLADEILKAPANTVPFNVRAQALAIKGRWTLALQSYVEGVRPFMPREYGSGLMYLVQNHPRLKRPDSLLIPNPLEAEKHFAAGLNFYFDRDYTNAEKEFLLTVENDPQDARYFYFLGLSRLGQSKRRDAFADFDEGAMLERLNRPSPAAVSESLERIQGPLRRIVNEVRTRPLER